MSYARVKSDSISHEPANSSGSGSGSGIAADPSSGFCGQMRRSFSSLSESPRELYLTFFLKFCEAYGYFALSQILVIYLHNEFDCSDMEAGTAYGLWGASIIFWGFATSCFNDQLGVRRSLLLGFSVSAISSLLLGFARSKVLVYVTLFGILPIGNCMGMPMLTIGIKRYTTPANRGFAFGLYYAAMNVAALASGPMVDFFNIVIRPSSGSQSFSGNRMVILSNTFVYLLSLLVTFCWLREIRVGDQDHEQDLEQQQVQGHTNVTTNPLQGQYSTVSAAAMVEVEQGYELTALRRDSDGDNPLHYRGGATSGGTSSPNNRAPISTMTPASSARASFSSYEILADLSTSPTFWRFVVFTLFLINLRTIFRHVDATLPTYLIRCFGPTYPKGMIYSINPFLIILLTPPLSALTAHWAHFDMIKYGGYASALSPLFVACSTSTWAVVLFMVMLSLGEAFWSPRLYDYTMSIAPEGKEASFSALASAPIFAAQVPVGLLSGYLVSTYLPQDGSRRDGKTLWLIICLLTLTSPVLITVCERWIREPSPSKRDEEADKVHAATDIDYADSDDEENTVTL